MPITRSTLTSLTLVILTAVFVSCGSSSDSDTATLSTDALLSDLTVEGVELDQTFQPAQDNYTASVNFLTRSISVLPVASDEAATLLVNGAAVASGSESGAIPLAEGNNIITLNVTAEDGATTSTYTFFINRAAVNEFAQQAYLKASNADGGVYFGYSVAVSGDTMVVGAWGENGDSVSTAITPNDNSSSVGAVYVFVRNGDGWSQQAYLKANNAEATDHFGYSVAIDGDTIVMGAVSEEGDSDSTADVPNNNASNAGAAYVFIRTGTMWSQQDYLKASNADDNDRFGNSVAIDGDTIVVGAYLQEGSTPGGAAYVYTRSGTSWSQQDYLKADNGDGGDQFGYSVDVDGDTIVVGARFEDGISNDADASGAAYVFTRSSSSWSQQDYLKADNFEANDYFGHSVSVSGNTVAVGAYLEDGLANDEFDTGAVYVFTRSGISWTQQDYLKANNVDAYDEFGISVAVSGDTLVVAAYREDGDNASTAASSNDNASNAGAAYVFTRTGTSWSQQADLKASNAEGDDRFGISVDVSGDTVVVGADYEDSSASGGELNNSEQNSGAVYVWQ